MTQDNTVHIGNSVNEKLAPGLAHKSFDYRSQALNFIDEYGAIDKIEHDGFAFYYVTVTRRLFDQTYRKILARGIRDGLVKTPKRTAVTTTEKSILPEEKSPFRLKSEHVVRHKLRS